MHRKPILIALAAVCLLSAAASAQVVGTAHDLSGTVAGSGQVCVFCHTPHGANDGPAGNDYALLLENAAPLWNQDINDAANNYGQYTSDTFDATDGADITRASYSVSLLCLSCHDGTVAPGSFYNAPNGGAASTATAITGSALVGLSIADDHPVNFTYANSIAQGDTGLNAAPADLLDSAGRVQCSSCHDPHDQGATKDPNVDFMQDTLEGSALCLQCHNK